MRGAADRGRVGETTDPVCGMAFDEEGAEELGATCIVHAGKRYWFCCPTCEEQFRADPARYAR